MYIKYKIKTGFPRPSRNYFFNFSCVFHSKRFTLYYVVSRSNNYIIVVQRFINQLINLITNQGLFLNLFKSVQFQTLAKISKMTEQRTLHLTLSEKPFQVMVTGEKPVELRKPSDWIKSRLFNKDGSRKDYDVVKLVNGYGKDKPFFIAIFNGFNEASSYSEVSYSNGLKVSIEAGDILIHLGDIIKKGNIKTCRNKT